MTPCCGEELVVTLAGSRTILFGGDLGRYGRPVLPDPRNAVNADVVLVESTYGDRDHPADDDGEALAGIIRETAKRGGKLIIPSFAIGRVEELVYWVRSLEQQQRIPVLPVYVDSPMATDALRFYAARVTELDPDMKPTEKHVSAFATSRFQAIASPQRWQAASSTCTAPAWTRRGTSTSRRWATGACRSSGRARARTRPSSSASRCTRRGDSRKSLRGKTLVGATKSNLGQNRQAIFSVENLSGPRKPQIPSALRFTALGTQMPCLARRCRVRRKTCSATSHPNADALWISGPSDVCGRGCVCGKCC